MVVIGGVTIIFSCGPLPQPCEVTEVSTGFVSHKKTEDRSCALQSLWLSTTGHSREARLKVEALTPGAVLLSMFPTSLALSVVWKVNYKTEHNV